MYLTLRSIYQEFQNDLSVVGFLDNSINAVDDIRDKLISHETVIRKFGYEKAVTFYGSYTRGDLHPGKLNVDSFAQICSVLAKLTSIQSHSEKAHILLILLALKTSPISMRVTLTTELMPDIVAILKEHYTEIELPKQLPFDDLVQLTGSWRIGDLILNTLVHSPLPLGYYALFRDAVSITKNIPSIGNDLFRDVCEAFGFTHRNVIVKNTHEGELEAAVKTRKHLDLFEIPYFGEKISTEFIHDKIFEAYSVGNTTITELYDTVKYILSIASPNGYLGISYANAYASMQAILHEQGGINLEMFSNILKDLKIDQALLKFMVFNSRRFMTDTILDYIEVDVTIPIKTFKIAWVGQESEFTNTSANIVAYNLKHNISRLTSVITMRQKQYDAVYTYLEQWLRDRTHGIGNTIEAVYGMLAQGDNNEAACGAFVTTINTLIKSHKEQDTLQDAILKYFQEIKVHRYIIGDDIEGENISRSVITPDDPSLDFVHVLDSRIQYRPTKKSVLKAFIKKLMFWK
jgi:hypothetical protein